MSSTHLRVPTSHLVAIVCTTCSLLDDDESGDCIWDDHTSYADDSSGSCPSATPSGGDPPAIALEQVLMVPKRILERRSQRQRQC